MATLSGNKIKNTYQSLVKFSDNGNITTSAKQLTDGFGNNSPIYVSTTQVGIGVTPESGLNLHVYGDAKIGSNLTVIGNLVVEGSTTTVGTDTLTVKDPLIVLANNNTSTDAVDIGFYGKYTPSSTTLYSGLFREALTGKYRLFKGLEAEPTTTVNLSGTGYAKADLIIGNIETNGLLEGSSSFDFTKNVTIDGTFSVTGGSDFDGTINQIKNSTTVTTFTGITGSGYNASKLEFFYNTGLQIRLNGEDGSITAGGNLGVGGTGAFTGQVTIPQTPTSNTHAASKGYVDTQIGANNELSEVLANGNTTGGTDIAITAGDKITNFTSTGIDDNASNNKLTITDSSATFSENVILDNGNSLRWTNDNVRIEGTTAGDNLTFYVNSQEILKLAQLETLATLTGNLSVSGTGTFAGDLTVNKSGNTLLDIQSTNDNAIIKINANSGGTGVANNQDPYLQFASGGTIKANIHYDNTATDLIFQTDTNTTALTIDNSGNSTFAGSVNAGAGLQMYTDGSGNGVIFNTGQNKDLYLVVDDNGTGVNALVFDGSENGNAAFAGNVQLGGTTPTLNFNKTSSADILANIKVETDAGSGGKLTIQTKRNGNTALDALVINDDQNATFTGYVKLDGGNQIYFVPQTGESNTEAMRIVRASDTMFFTYGVNANEEAFSYDSSGNTTFAGNVTSSGNIGSTIDANTTNQVSVTNSNSGSSATARFLAVSDSGNIQIKAVSSTNTTYGAGDVGVINCDTMSGGLRFAHNDQVKYTLGFDGFNTWTGGGSFAGTVSITSGQRPTTGKGGALIVGGDADGTGLTTNTRKLALINCPSYNNSNGNMSMVTGDTSSSTVAKLVFGSINTGYASPTQIGFHTTSTVGAIGTEKMRITGGGNINLGTGSLTQVSYQLRVDSDFDNGIYMSAGSSSGNYAMYIEKSTGGTSIFNVRGDGNVGIGTDSPHNDAGGLSISATSSTDQLYLERTGSGTGRYYLGTASNSFYIVDDAQSATRMVIDSSGNVGIGTTSPSVDLHVKDSSQNSSITDTIPSWWNAIFERSYTTSSLAAVGLIGGTEATGSAGALYLGYSDNVDSNYILVESNDLLFGVNGSERMRITSGGNVAIGGTLGADSQFRVELKPAGTILAGLRIGYNSTSNNYFDGDNQYFRDGAGTTNRMTITSGGNVQVANSVTGGTFTVGRNGNNESILVESDANNTSEAYIRGYSTGAGSSTFYVWSNGNVQNINNSYTAISDIKLKENIVDATPKLDDLMKVKIKNYNLIGTDLKQIGVVAQELEDVFPNLIDEHQDKGKDENGKQIDLETTTKSVKYSVFVPILIKAIQELTAKVEKLEKNCNCK